ncbi:MAG: hypothetical protein LQ344_000456 [Seirophora lacunosa]|nr:MAG: hypothetical protein LQ344_000456 [Seirophora lacunosa]
MAWPGNDLFNDPRVGYADHPARGRHRQASDLPRQTRYFTDGFGQLLPHAGPGLGRSNSVSGGRPAQIVINNTQRDEFSPPHSARPRRKSHARSPSYDDDDDSWDERAHSPRRHPDCSRDRSRDRPRRRSHTHSYSHKHLSRSPSPAPKWDHETELKMRKLEELEKREEEEAAREKAKQELLLAEAKKAAKAKEEEAFRQRVLAEAEREKYEQEMAEKKKKEEEDRVFKARLKDLYLAQGYSEESIELMIMDADKKKKKKKSHGSPSPHSPHAIAGHSGDIVKIPEQTKVMDLSKQTYIKVHRKYLSPDTLDAYELPWEWDDVSFHVPLQPQTPRDSNYIIIKRWVNGNDQDKLFEHTRRLREQRLLTNETVELKKENGKLKLVREKSPSRQRSRSTSRWMFT